MISAIMLHCWIWASIYVLACEIAALIVAGSGHADVFKKCSTTDHCMVSCAQGEISDEEFKAYFDQFGEIEDCVASALCPAPLH